MLIKGEIIPNCNYCRIRYFLLFYNHETNYEKIGDQLKVAENND